MNHRTRTTAPYPILLAGVWIGLAGSFGAARAQGEPASDPQAQSRFITNAHRITFEGRRTGEGYFSPDDRLMIFSSEREPGNPFYQIYILDLETGESHRVSPGTGKTTCAYFRGMDDEVLFSSTHLDPNAKTKQKEELELRASGKERRYSWDFDEYYDIFSAKIDGSDLTRLTDEPGYDAEASYSPDGSRIVFASNRHAYPVEKLSEEDRKRIAVDPAYFLDLYIMDADGGNQVRLTDWPGYDGGPFFSPDGERILWRHFTGDMMRADIYTMKTDGTDIHRLTDFGAMSWAPFYHPSGKYVIFTSNKLGFGNFESYIVDAKGTREPVRVTFADGFDGLSIFSNSGNLLTWTANRTENGMGQLFLGRWNHEAALEALEASPVREIPTAAGEPGRSALGGGSGPPPPDGEDPRGGRRLEPELSPDITALDLRAHVDLLASDDMGGRLTGTPEVAEAARYIAARFEEAGLEPAGDDGTFFQEFEFTAGVEPLAGHNHLTIEAGSELAGHELEAGRDFRPLAFSSNGEGEGEVVFAGYGLVVPGGPGEGYDSYQGLEVEDKIVMVLRYVPEDVSVERRSELNTLAALRYKAMLARERGARALLVVTGPNSPNAGELVPLTLDTSLQGSGILAASITTEVADALLAGAGKTIAELQTGLDPENPHFEGSFAVPDGKVVLELALERQRKSCRNVLAMIPPQDPGEEAEYVVLGAHYDHIGHGEVGGSLARKGEEGQVHNGADDNASGTAMVLELAATLAEARRTGALPGTRGFLFACWSGEEIGLIGSHHFVEHAPFPLEKIIAYLNFDMVGRVRENRLVLQGTGSSPDWKELIERKNIAAGFDVQIQEDPYLPTDATSFYPEKIPVLAFFTGSHQDYNRPTDDASTLNYEGMERIGAFARAIALDLASRGEGPAYAVVEKSSTGTTGQGGLRAYTGTIPDYAADDIKGVKLSGVRPGGPADKAGIRGGDIIVRFAGLEITNIYDYSYALNAVKVGEPVEVVLRREGELLTLSVVPEAR